MKKQRYSGIVILAMSAVMIGSAGCAGLGGSAADVALTGAGGALGYEVSDHKIEGAAVGAAAGYVASRVAQTEVKRSDAAAEKRGYDRAMNQAVKQQYWIIQNQQRSSKPETKAAMVPVVVPESNVNGVIRKESVAFVPVGP